VSPPRRVDRRALVRGLVRISCSTEDLAEHLARF
jgi:hypothetical protein